MPRDYSPRRRGCGAVADRFDLLADSTEGRSRRRRAPPGRGVLTVMHPIGLLVLIALFALAALARCLEET